MNNLDKLLGKKDQNIKCCAMCSGGHISDGSHKDTFWICEPISEYLGEQYYVNGSEVCDLFRRIDEPEKVAE